MKISTTIQQLSKHYENLNAELIEKQNCYGERELLPLMKQGMPILYKIGFKVAEKNELIDSILKTLGPGTFVPVRYGDFAIPEEYLFNRKIKQIQLEYYLNECFIKKQEQLHYLGNYELNREQLEHLQIEEPFGFKKYDFSNGLLWIGESGCVTPLHCDGGDNIVYQLVGSKKWILFPPSDLRYLSIKTDAGNPQQDFLCSEIDLLNPDLIKFSKFTKAHPIQITLNAGDALYLPYGWFHFVQTTEDSVMVNFRVLNLDLTPAVLKN